MHLNVTLALLEAVDHDDVALLQNLGCHGGRPDWAWYKVMQNGGAATEKEYPYRARKGTCQVWMSTSSFAVLRVRAAFIFCNAPLNTRPSHAPFTENIGWLAWWPQAGIISVGEMQSACWCRFNRSWSALQVGKLNDRVVTIQDFSYVPANSERDLMKVRSPLGCTPQRVINIIAWLPCRTAGCTTMTSQGVLAACERLNKRHEPVELMGALRCRRCRTNPPASSLTRT